MSTAVQLPPETLTIPRRMTVAEFLARPGDGTGTIYELVNGEVRAQEAASDTHGTMHGNLSALITNHLRAKKPGCRLVVAPGVRPRLLANWNHRIPELGVTCVPNRVDVRTIPDPVLLIEILSPSNYEDTWSNIPLYASLPSVTEILIVDSTKIAAELLRRGPDGSWPQEPASVATNGTIHLESIDLDIPMAEVYRDTHLAGN
jgi:Uma2 family endonuclease